MTVHRPLPDAAPAAAYDDDFALWCEAQARALAAGDGAALDWANLAEEIDSLGKSQRNALESRLAVIIEHLLKLAYGRNRDPAGKWRSSVQAQRVAVRRLLRQNPSLRSLVRTCAEQEYADVRLLTLTAFEEYEPALRDEYDADLPTTLPYTPEQLLNLAFLPEPPSA